MKIWLLSDIRAEVVDWSPPSIPEADICVVAGDIACGGREAVEWAAWHVRPHMPAIGILGNHEFYRHVMSRERSEAQYAGRRHDVQMLDNMTWTEGSVRFVGATLWTDYALDGDPERAMARAAVQMRDHSVILAGDGSSVGRFTPRHAENFTASRCSSSSRCWPSHSTVTPSSSPTMDRRRDRSPRIAKATSSTPPSSAT